MWLHRHLPSQGCTGEEIGQVLRRTEETSEYERRVAHRNIGENKKRSPGRSHDEATAQP